MKTIKQKKPNEKQVNNVFFIVNTLHIPFEGNIQDRDEVEDFLASYLEEAENYLEEYISMSIELYNL